MSNDDSDEEYRPTSADYEQEMKDAVQDYDQESRTPSIITYCVKNIPCSIKSISEQMQDKRNNNKSDKMEESDSEPEQEGNISQ